MKNVVCQGCAYFYITHRVDRPWGCRKFGFISKFLPYQEVFSTTGTECAYYLKKKMTNNKIEDYNE